MRLDYDQIFAERGTGYHRQMAEQPEAREQEFSQAIAAADLQAGQLVLDVPSGGAYLSRYLPESVRYVAVETCAVFYRFAQQRVGDQAIRVASLEQTGLPGSSVDRVLSISGLHHIEDRYSVYCELTRLLRPGGLAVLADVSEQTPVAAFLNGFVDQHNSQGHQGYFFNARDKQDAERAGLLVQSSQLVHYAWQFSSEPAMLKYCRGLFGIEAGDAELLAALQTLGVQHTAHGVSLQWQLQHLLLRKPTSLN